MVVLGYADMGYEAAGIKVGDLGLEMGYAAMTAQKQQQQQGEMEMWIVVGGQWGLIGLVWIGLFDTPPLSLTGLADASRFFTVFLPCVLIFLSIL